MSHLRLFDPPVSVCDLEEPEIIPFRPQCERLGSDTLPAGGRFTRQRSEFEVLQRSRVIHENRHCPSCHHPVVEPLELRDAALNRNGMPIPGTATLVGFHCTRCDYEWPA